jgi:hypothetical protein
MSAPPREAANDYSSGSRLSRAALRRWTEGAPTLRVALAGLAAVAVVLLVVSEFLPLYRVVVGTLEIEQRSEAGWRNHAFAVLLLALAAVPMLLGALRGARPAMWALGGIGLVVLLVALTVDLPAARESGTLRESVAYEDARAQPAAGFFVETLGGVLLLLAAGLMLLLTPPRAGATEDAI